MQSTTLPEALTAQILQHVPQQQRMKQCALVCKAWAAAATHVTVTVERRLDNMPRHAFAALERWLAQHADQLESLQLSFGTHSERHQLQLPLDKLGKLQRLQLDGFTLRLPGDRLPAQRPKHKLGRWTFTRLCRDSGSDSDERAAVYRGSSSSSSGEEESEEEEIYTAARMPLPSLQHLQLSRVQLASISSLLRLADAPALTSLKADEVSFGQHDGSLGVPTQQLAAAVAGLLQQLPRLAVLELPGLPISDTAVQHMGAMQGLQQVSLAHVDPMPPCKLQHLPNSITQLCLQGNYDRSSSYGAEPSLPPRLQQLSGLLRLQLWDCCVPPTALASFTRMQVLQMEQCDLALDRGDYLGATATLLNALAGMTCLQDLQLSAVPINTSETDPQRFAALTASTQLTRLVLRSGGRIPLPHEAAQHMFRAGRPLPQLQQLVITPLLDDTDHYNADTRCIDDDGIGCIASCCTGLQWLEIPFCVPPFRDLSVMLQLPPSCRALTVGGYAFRQGGTSVLGQLTQLTYLCVCNTRGFKDTELEQLASLDLDRLYVYNCGLSDVVCESGRLDLRSSIRKVRCCTYVLQAIPTVLPQCAAAGCQQPTCMQSFCGT
jgi:Leucine-rich repeat (LRR) protein